MVQAVRQIYGEYDNDTYTFMLWRDRPGASRPRTAPVCSRAPKTCQMTIDAQYVVGCDWLRNPQARFVYDWGKIAWFGLSIEQPGAVFPGAPSAATVSPPGPIVTSINNTCTGSSHLNGTTTCSNDVAPDIIEKFALDPGFGHYELLGIERWFSDEVANTTFQTAGRRK
jgi:hypothetical protein